MAPKPWPKGMQENWKKYLMLRGVKGYVIMDRVDFKHLRLKMSYLWFQALFHLHNLLNLISLSGE